MQRQSRPGGSPDNTMASLCLTCGQESDSAGPTHNCLLSPSLTFDNDFIPPAMQSVWSKLWVTLKCSNNHCNFETRLQSPAGAVNQLRNHIITRHVMGVGIGSLILPSVEQDKLGRALGAPPPPSPPMAWRSPALFYTGSSSGSGNDSSIYYPSPRQTTSRQCNCSRWSSSSSSCSSRDSSPARKRTIRSTSSPNAILPDLAGAEDLAYAPLTSPINSD